MKLDNQLLSEKLFASKPEAFSRKICFQIPFFTILILYILYSPTNALAAEPSLLFSPESVATNLNATFTVDIILDTAGIEVGGADAVIKFKPSFANAVSIQTGKIFNDYPATLIDNQKGEVKISGIVSSINNLYSGRDVFASLTFQTKSPGTASINFYYLPGSTRDSNISVTYGSGDVLSKVNSLKLTISETVQAGSSTTPTTTPTSSPKIRPTSQPIDPHQPIPSQPPITDPDQEQPTQVPEESYLQSPKLFLSQINKRVLLVILLLLAVIVISIFIFLKKRKVNQLPFDSPPNQDNPLL